MTFAQLGLIVAGLTLLIVGAEMLVRGASRIAAMAGMSPLTIGLTVVAYGTSAPELAVSIGTALSGQADISLGNVIGSNIFNILFILGICAVIVPLHVARQLVWLDVPVLIGTSLLLLLMALDGRLSRIDGAILFVGAVMYTAFLIRQGRKDFVAREQMHAQPPATPRRGSWPNQVLFVVLGLVMLVYGARWLVAGAVAVAKLFGMSDFVVGLTIVAAGSSLPEVAASVVASLRGARDIAVGTVVGSSIFNILAVLGLSSLVAPDGIPVPGAALAFDIPVMIAVALACSPIFFTGHLISRWEGALFLAYYVAYTSYLVLDAKGHESLPAFSAVMLQFVLPLTLVTLAIVYTRHAAQARSQNG